MNTQGKITNKSNKISMDELGKWIKNGFSEARVDLLDVKNELEQKMNLRFNGIQGQLDNMHLNYLTLREHSILKDRVKKIERKVGIKM